VKIVIYTREVGRLDRQEPLSTLTLTLNSSPGGGREGAANDIIIYSTAASLKINVDVLQVLRFFRIFAEEKDNLIVL
jgi:hypothetical protein